MGKDANANIEKPVAIVILDKVDFKSKKMTRNKKGHYVMSKGESTKKTQQS